MRGLKGNRIIKNYVILFHSRMLSTQKMIKNVVRVAEEENPVSGFSGWRRACRMPLLLYPRTCTDIKVVLS